MEEQEKYKLSLFINSIRDNLLKAGYFEHHLYSTTDYKIENADYFALKDNLYLRFNPEPDIWQVGINHDKFFWIGSMFRNEKELSELHQYEFTVADIYRAHATIEEIVVKYFEILKNLESELKLRPLSNLKVKYITYNEFNDQESSPSKEPCWYIVTDYPIEESFYDTQGKDKEYTSKFEIFFVNKDRRIEIAACGTLGSNLNPINFIKDRGNTISSKLIDKNFVGFGIGLERLMYLYKQV